MLDYFNILENDSYQDLDIEDSEGWTVLQRVAAFGQPEEVAALIKHGADLLQIALPLCWNALHHAVFYGNYPTFHLLTPHYDKTMVSMTDKRGWTLLHIAASAGHDHIVRRLLKMGADPYARSTPFFSHMPEELYGRRCTPQEVAAAQNQEKQQQYLKALEDFGVYPDKGGRTDAGLCRRVCWSGQVWVLVSIMVLLVTYAMGVSPL